MTHNTMDGNQEHLQFRFQNVDHTTIGTTTVGTTNAVVMIAVGTTKAMIVGEMNLTGTWALNVKPQDVPVMRTVIYNSQGLN